MAEYTYKDVIIDPDDPRIEIGKEYYRADFPKRVLCLANNDEDYIGTLEEIDTESPETPFVVKNGGSYSPWACIIRKKEPEKKYVPFDLSKEEDRARLREAWIRPKGRSSIALKIIAMNIDCVFIHGEKGQSPGDLLNEYEFIDGTPCGKQVKEEE